MIHWHRLFGMTLTDFFTDTAFRVELEKDLSMRQQLLDVVIIEQDVGRPLEIPPDGLESLGPHNLLTYKSHQQVLDAWTLDELIGHYVNYRKSISPPTGGMLPSETFNLYAVSARYPAKLASDVNSRLVKPGVYDVRWGARDIRIIVLSQISADPKNAVWQLFSAVPKTVAAGAMHYQWRSPVSSVMNELLKNYNLEGIITMPYTIEDYQRDYAREYIDKLTPEEILESYPLEKLLKKLPMEERLKGVSPVDDDRLKGVTVDDRLKGVPVDERLKRIPVDDLSGAILDDLLLKLLKKKLSSTSRDEVRKLLAKLENTT